MKKTSPLSQQEKAILNQLARYDGNAVIPELLYPAEPRTASQAASFSRCLRRLQRRGLVTLHTFRPVRRGERTDLVSATVPGLAVASQKGPPPPARREPPGAPATTRPPVAASLAETIARLNRLAERLGCDG